MPEQKAVEYLCIYDPAFLEEAQIFLDEFGTNAAVEPVNNTAEIQVAVQKYAMVRYLEIDLHGSPGMLHFPSGGAMTGTYFGTLLTNANTLCRDARVLFLGCNVAHGTEGDKFLEDFGKNTFKGIGGTVGATTVLNSGWHGGVYLKKIKLWQIPSDEGRLKTCRFDLNGEEIGAREVGRWGKVYWSWSNVPVH